jgi:hypothetical protein
MTTRKRRLSVFCSLLIDGIQQAGEYVPCGIDR